MTSTARMFRRHVLRIPRKALVVFMLMAHLFATGLHSWCDIDVVKPHGRYDVVHVKESTPHVELGFVVDLECHGCFPVSVGKPVTTASRTMPIQLAIVAQDAHRSGLPPGVDPPPPKSLT
jgi:hypothetical protein